MPRLPCAGAIRRVLHGGHLSPAATGRAFDGRLARLVPLGLAPQADITGIRFAARGFVEGEDPTLARSAGAEPRVPSGDDPGRSRRRRPTTMAGAVPDDPPASVWRRRGLDRRLVADGHIEGGVPRMSAVRTPPTPSTGHPGVAVSSSGWRPRPLARRRDPAGQAVGRPTAARASSPRRTRTGAQPGADHRSLVPQGRFPPAA